MRELDALRAAVRRHRGGSYVVPSVLAGGDDPRVPVDAGDPYRFYESVLDRIPSVAPPVPGAGLAADDVVYLTFPRTFAALDGRIGTALSQLAFLPYLRERLGVTVLVCLPTGVIGRSGRKGSRGSPFAVADPFDVDPSLADPLLPELSALDQYRALVQACHALGMRAGSVVPLATLAPDSPLFAQCPELGFWWEAEPDEPLAWAGPDDPRTTAASFPWLEISPECRRRFVPAPLSLRPGLSLAPAFPGRRDDAGTYTWDDVAMLNFTTLDHPLPAGCHTPELDGPSRPAWALAAAMVAWRGSVLGEDVLLVDVSGTVPDRVFRMARALCERPVTFVGEQVWRFDAFTPSVDAVVGPLVFCVSAHTANPPLLAESLDHHLRALEKRSDSNPFLAGAANHDTMPPLPELAPLLYLVYAFLPGAVPLVYSGNEFHAQLPTNKEFGFDTTPALSRRRAALTDDVLPLFNDVPLDWTSLPSRDGLGRPLVDLGWLLRRRALLLAGLGPGYEVVPHGYRRGGLVVLVNWDGEEPLVLEWTYGPGSVVLSVHAPEGPVAPGERVVLPPLSGAAWLVESRAPALAPRPST